MPVVLVVGASRGIGLGLVRAFLAEGWRVHATTRTPGDPGPLGTLAGDLEIHPLEVRDAGQIARLRDALAGEPLDVLIHNAGVYGTGMSRAEVMRINAEAPIALAEALLDAVARSGQRKLVLVTSQMGARHGSRRGLGTYGESKAALNDAFRERAPDWGRRGVTAVVVHPGWVRTDMGGRSAAISVEESAAGIVRLVAAMTAEHHGRFWTWEGREHPW